MAIERVSFPLNHAITSSRLEVGANRKMNRHLLSKVKRITSILADDYVIRAKAIKDLLTPELVRFKLLTELEDIYCKISEQNYEANNISELMMTEDKLTTSKEERMMQ